MMKSPRIHTFTLYSGQFLLISGQLHGFCYHPRVESGIINRHLIIVSSNEQIVETKLIFYLSSANGTLRSQRIKKSQSAQEKSSMNKQNNTPLKLDKIISFNRPILALHITYYRIHAYYL